MQRAGCLTSTTVRVHAFLGSLLAPVCPAVPLAWSLGRAGALWKGGFGVSVWILGIGIGLGIEA